MRQVELQHAKERILELIDLALGGEEVIISKDKKPLVKLSPILKKKKQRHFGSARGLFTIAEDFNDPLEDFKEFM